MTDRELLELAAKAAGIEILAWTYSGYAVVSDKGDTWIPLTDDGDALRLAIELRVDLEWSSDGRVAAYRRGDEFAAFESSREDRAANTRRAIVRAAAEIGRAMP